MSCERGCGGDGNRKPRATLRVLALLEATSITGTAKAVLELGREAQADSDDRGPIELHVALFSRGDGTPENVLTDKLNTFHIPYSFVREKGRFDSAVIPQIQELVQKHKPHVVWTNSVKSHFLVHKAGVQKYCRWVAFHHGYTSTDFKMRLYNQLDRVSLRNADRVMTVCWPFAKQMEERGVSGSRIRVQHMPIRPFGNSEGDGALLRGEMKLDAADRVILSVGRLSHEKGHAELVKAFSILRDQLRDEHLKLVLVGDGPERNRLEQMAGEGVLFAGHRDDAQRFYGIADVFVLPSYTEGTPNVLLEAMAAGVPIVATNVGGIPELAADGRTALLVPAADPAALAGALRRLVESAELRRELARAAGETVASHSPRAYFERMREIFAEAVGA